MELAVCEQLGEKVERLIRAYDELKRENESLTGMLKLKDEEIGKLTTKLDKLGKEKGLAKEKVENILARLEGLIQTA